MNRIALIVVAFWLLFAIAWLWFLRIQLYDPVRPAPLILFISGGTSSEWQRTVDGARAAARDLGATLQVKTPSAENPELEQASFVREIKAAEYDGVAFCPASPATQIDLINNLAARINLVTVGEEYGRSNRLCHVGFRPDATGIRVAWLIRDALPHGGTVALLVTDYADVDREGVVRERIDSFRNTCAQWDSMPSAHRCPLTEIDVASKRDENASRELSKALSDSGARVIVAFDSWAAEAALLALPQIPSAKRAPIIAFDPTSSVLDAISDGRVSFSMYDDPYKNGYAAVACLIRYHYATKPELPGPGCGFISSLSDRIDKVNLPDLRPRVQPQVVKPWRGSTRAAQKTTLKLFSG